MPSTLVRPKGITRQSVRAWNHSSPSAYRRIFQQRGDHLVPKALGAVVILRIIDAVKGPCAPVRCEVVAELALSLFALAAAAAIKHYQRRKDDRRAFLAGAATIAGVMASVFSGLFPKLLPSLSGRRHPGLDIYNSAAPEGSLRIALWIYVFGMSLVILYLVNIYRVWRGKVVEERY